MDAMDSGLWNLILAGIGVFAFEFILLLFADLLPEIVDYVKAAIK